MNCLIMNDEEITKCSGVERNPKEYEYYVSYKFPFTLRTWLWVNILPDHRIRINFLNCEFF